MFKVEIYFLTFPNNEVKKNLTKLNNKIPK